MNRRDFLQPGFGATAALTLASAVRSFGEPLPTAADPLLLHRFGMDYTPSKNWYYSAGTTSIPMPSRGISTRWPRSGPTTSGSCCCGRIFNRTAAVAVGHEHFLGFDLGNEINCYWSTTDLPKGDAWLERALALCESIAPHATAHVEGVDHQPWFAPTTFGEAGFGEIPGLRGRTDWKTPDIWLRRHFNPGGMTADDVERIVARDLHDEDVQVYINGVEAYRKGGYTKSYAYRFIRPQAKAAIKPDADNVLAVHCLQTEGGQFIDVGLYERVPTEK